MTDREAFEARMLGEFGPCLGRDKHGDYENAVINGGWDDWKAGVRWATAEGAGVCRAEKGANKRWNNACEACAAAVERVGECP